MLIKAMEMIIKINDDTDKPHDLKSTPPQRNNMPAVADKNITSYLSIDKGTAVFLELIQNKHKCHIRLKTATI